MKRVELLVLTTVIIVMMCGGCAQKGDMSAAQEWVFEMEKLWEIQKIGEDELLLPAEPRVADDGTLYFHDFERHLSYIIDGDLSNIVDIGDLTALIDYLFITFAVPECMEEANCDGSVGGVVDIGDLTALIDYLFISFTPPAACL